MGTGSTEQTREETSSQLPELARELLTEALPDIPEAIRGDPGDPVPLFLAQAIPAALLDRSGRVLQATAGFEAFSAGDLIEPGKIAAALRSSSPVVSIVSLSDGAEAAAFVYAPAGEAAGWRLPPEIAEAAAARQDAVVVLTTHGGAAGPPLLLACQAYGLTGLQSRVVLEAIRTGALKAAAAQVGVSYHTAREALAEAMRRTQCQRMPQLVSKLTELGFGVLPQEPKDALADIWGLSARQSAIASLVASGMTRAEAAKALRIGEATVKKELDQIYAILQVNSAPALARKVVETRALRWLTHVTRGDAGFLQTGAEPLQFVHSPDGRRIAISDHGPATGRPVLYMHSATTTRYIPRALLRALHAAGYRPISVDRPGFGLTDDVAPGQEGDHFYVAAADIARVLDRLKVDTIDVVSRASMALLALHEQVPHRLARVVMINPGLPRTLDHHAAGLFGQLKALFAAHPAVISVMLRAYLQNLTLERLSESFRRWAEGSPNDAAAARDPEVTRDYFMSARMLITGRLSGALREIARYSAETPSAPLPGVDWTVLTGGHDMLYDVEQSTAYWRAVLPAGRFRLAEDAGRLLAMTHPDAVISALKNRSLVEAS